MKARTVARNRDLRSQVCPLEYLRRIARNQAVVGSVVVIVPYMNKDNCLGVEKCVDMGGVVPGFVGFGLGRRDIGCCSRTKTVYSGDIVTVLNIVTPPATGDRCVTAVVEAEGQLDGYEGHLPDRKVVIRRDRILCDQSLAIDVLQKLGEDESLEILAEAPQLE